MITYMLDYDIRNINEIDWKPDKIQEFSDLTIWVEKECFVENQLKRFETGGASEFKKLSYFEDDFSFIFQFIWK